MILRTPDYYYTFKCIADKCRDNCCIGWEIDIDEDTHSYYKSTGGSFGERLRGNISGGSFILGDDERCPFLNSRNLCDIYTTLGEEHLCRICTEHPRFYEWFGSFKEGGIGLCCEESARIILSSDADITEREIQENDDTQCDEELLRTLLSARELITEHLRTESLSTAVCTMLDFAEELQYRLDNGDYSLPDWESASCGGNADISGILSFFASLEPIDPQWPEKLKALPTEETLLPPLTAEDGIYLRRIGEYFIYRYFLKGVFDGEILSRVKLAAVSIWLTGWLWRSDRAVSLNDRAWLAKNYSKEVEYCEENIDAFADASYEKPYFTAVSLKGLF
ncbi:MAG TPA: flagellin lysine-N-methylase [Ruminococcus sp.]|nr:flagellin lysine-N-methylase [Ruminococcus sp.]